MRGKLYSTAAVRRFCSEAQDIIATTDLQAKVDLFDDITDFIGSDATPYRDEGEGLPLVTTSYLAYSTDDDGKEYIQGILCKMKSADGLNDAYPGLGAVKTNCGAVNRAFYARVVNSLTRREKEVITLSDIEFDTWTSFSGPQWTDDAPAPFAYMSTVDGKLHFVGKELYINVNNGVPFIGPEKKGVDYCQVPSAEYIHRLITGEVTAPTCDAPPPYSPNPFEEIPTWECQNPIN